MKLQRGCDHNKEVKKMPSSGHTFAPRRKFEETKQVEQTENQYPKKGNARNEGQRTESQRNVARGQIEKVVILSQKLYQTD
jgi:hypothetical protein